MGGTIRLLAEFKGAAPIELVGLGSLGETKKALPAADVPKHAV